MNNIIELSDDNIALVERTVGSEAQYKKNQKMIVFDGVIFFLAGVIMLVTGIGEGIWFIAGSLAGITLASVVGFLIAFKLPELEQKH